MVVIANKIDVVKIVVKKLSKLKAKTHRYRCRQNNNKKNNFRKK